MSDTQLSHTRLWRPPGGATATAAPGFSRGSRGPATAGGRVSVSEDSDVAGPVDARSAWDRKLKGLNVLLGCSAASSLPLCFASLSKSRGTSPYTSREYSNPGGRTTGASRQQGGTYVRVQRGTRAAGDGGPAAGCPAAGSRVEGQEERRAGRALFGGARPTWAAPTPAHRGCGRQA